MPDKIDPIASSLRRIKALMVKEFFQTIRDPSSILIGFILPAILLFIYAYGVSLDIKHLRIGLVMEDTAPDAQSFAKSLTNSPYFHVEISRVRKELEEQVVKGYLRGIVIIPSYFSSFRDKPDTIAPIQVIADASDPNTSVFVQNYVMAAFQNWLVQESITKNLQGLPMINIENRFWFNTSLDSKHFLIPGSLAVIMTLIGVLLTSLVLARDWERGNMEALMATPVRISEIILGKLLFYFLMGTMSFLISTIISIFIFGVPLRGSLMLLLFVGSIFLLTALGLGLLISTITKNQLVASQAAFVVGFMPAYMLSGFIFEIFSMPAPIRFLTYFMPARYFVTCLKTIFLAGNVWHLIITNVLAMLAFALIFYLAAVRLTVKRLD